MAQGQRVDALLHEIGQIVPTTALAPGIAEAAGNPPGQTHAAVDTRQQRDAAIAGDITNAQISLDLATFNGWKLQRSTVTFCHGGWSLKDCGKPLFSWTFRRFSIPHSRNIRASGC